MRITLCAEWYTSTQTLVLYHSPLTKKVTITKLYNCTDTPYILYSQFPNMNNELSLTQILANIGVTHAGTYCLLCGRHFDPRIGGFTSIDHTLIFVCPNEQTTLPPFYTREYKLLSKEITLQSTLLAKNSTRGISVDNAVTFSALIALLFGIYPTPILFARQTATHVL